MANVFNALKASLTPEAQAKVAQTTEQMLQEMSLHKLRHARGLSQKMMAETLHIQQPAVEKLKNVPTCIYQPCAAIFRPWVEC